MIPFKPYIRIEKTKDKNYRLYVLVSLKNGYQIGPISSKNVKKNKVRLSVVRSKENRVQILEEYTFLLTGLKKGDLVKVFVETSLPGAEFDKEEKEGIDLKSVLSKNKKPITRLGIAVGATEGVEGEDDRTGMEKKRTKSTEDG